MGNCHQFGLLINRIGKTFEGNTVAGIVNVDDLNTLPFLGMCVLPNRWKLKVADDNLTAVTAEIERADQAAHTIGDRAGHRHFIRQGIDQPGKGMPGCLQFLDP